MPAMTQTAPDVAALLALQRSAGNAAALAMLRRAVAPVRLLQREPSEQKIKERAYEIWERKGRPPGQTKEQEAQDYFEAKRRVEIEERAYSNWQAKGEPPNQSEQQRALEYYEAEKQLKAEAAAAAPVAAQVEKDAETPKETASAEQSPPEAEPKEATQEAQAEPVAAQPVVPQPVPAQPVAPQQIVAQPAAPARYVPPNRRANFVPQAVAQAPAAVVLAPGWKADGQLRNLGFVKAQARWQKNRANFHGFQVHISVNPVNNAFDEFHVKFDLPRTSHRVYYFYDASGAPKWDKSSPRTIVRAALLADGCRQGQVNGALADIDAAAAAEAQALASNLV
jgi:hypothetical protein